MKTLLRRINPVRRLVEHYRFWRNLTHGMVAVEINNTIGLGARLAWVLEVLAFCEEQGLSPCFRFTWPGSREDFFHRFFQIHPAHAGRCRPEEHNRIFTIGELGLAKNYDRLLSVEWAHRLITTYLVVLPEIVEEVDRFTDAKFAAHTLGVHYRGTDKNTEAPAVSRQRVERNILHYLERHPETDSIFVASDDARFIEFMAAGPLAGMVCWREDAFRSRDGSPVHLTVQDRYAVNRDALVNCLLLSRCNALIKTASILSAWSVLFNPEIRLVMLNHPYEQYFPERALKERAAWEPV